MANYATRHCRKCPTWKLRYTVSDIYLLTHTNTIWSDFIHCRVMKTLTFFMNVSYFSPHRHPLHFYHRNSTSISAHVGSIETLHEIFWIASPKKGWTFVSSTRGNGFCSTRKGGPLVSTFLMSIIQYFPRKIFMLMEMKFFGEKKQQRMGSKSLVKR